jgi:hypothetical protein
MVIRNSGIREVEEEESGKLTKPSSRSDQKAKGTTAVNDLGQCDMTQQILDRLDNLTYNRAMEMGRTAKIGHQQQQPLAGAEMSPAAVPVAMVVHQLAAATEVVVVHRLVAATGEEHQEHQEQDRDRHHLPRSQTSWRMRTGHSFAALPGNWNSQT